MKESPDPLLARIVAFVADKGGGVVVRKLGGGYSLFHEESGPWPGFVRPEPETRSR